MSQDKIKEVSLSNGLDYEFIINSYPNLPIMRMSNVIIPENLDEYVYVFEYNERIINDHKGLLQFKSYGSLKSISIIKIKHEDFKLYYEINLKSRQI